VNLNRDIAVALADLTIQLRPDWDRNGVLAASQQATRAGVDAHAHCAAMIRAAARPANRTPVSAGFTSSLEPMPTGCREHPEAGTRVDGECAGCWADRFPGDVPIPPRQRPDTTAGRAAARAALRHEEGLA
jgi:hypothetical protein